MRGPSRPAHHRLTPAEMAGFSATQDQRDRERGFLLALLLASSPALVPLAIYALSAIGWL